MNTFSVSDGLRWCLDVCVEGEGEKREKGREGERGREQWVCTVVNKDSW